MMRNDMIVRTLLTGCCLLSAPLPVANAQQAAAEPTQITEAPVVALLGGGEMLAVRSIEAGDGGVWQFVLADGSRRREAAERVLSLHGGPSQDGAESLLRLVGGEVLRGKLVGGDASGDVLQFESVILGRQEVPVDRLELLVFPSGRARPEDLELPEGIEEALFLPARIGLDRLAGTLYRFGEGRLQFLVDGEEGPRWFGPEEAVGLRLGGGLSRQDEASDVELVTRQGDRLRARFVGLTDAGCRLGLEGGRQVALAWREVSALTFRRDGLALASRLPPVEVRESGFDGPTLMPWRRDGAVAGGPLSAIGRTFGSGFGVHSRSRLSFRAPPGTRGFWSRFAFDDTATRLLVRGSVDLRVEVDGEVVFERRGYRVGDGFGATGSLKVAAGQVVSLIVDFGTGRELADRIAWISPAFVLGS
jgi:hypothetical protein